MAMTASARANAIYAAASAMPGFSSLSTAEQNGIKSNIQTIFGADLTYIQANAAVVPGSFAVPAGVPVATAGSAAAQTGATTGPGTVLGAGQVT